MLLSCTNRNCVFFFFLFTSLVLVPILVYSYYVGTHKWALGRIIGPLLFSNSTPGVGTISQHDSLALSLCYSMDKGPASMGLPSFSPCVFPMVRFPLSWLQMHPPWPCIFYSTNFFRFRLFLSFFFVFLSTIITFLLVPLILPAERQFSTACWHLCLVLKAINAS